MNEKKRRKQNWYRVGMKNESNDFDGSFATHLQALQLAALGFEEIGAELKNWYKANCIVSLPSACFMTWFRWMAWIDDDRLERVNEWEMGERTYRGTCNLNWLASKVSIFAFIRPNVCLPTSCLLGDCKCTVVSVSLADSRRHSLLWPTYARIYYYCCAESQTTHGSHSHSHHKCTNLVNKLQWNYNNRVSVFCCIPATMLSCSGICFIFNGTLCRVSFTLHTMGHRVRYLVVWVSFLCSRLHKNNASSTENWLLPNLSRQFRFRCRNILNIVGYLMANGCVIETNSTRIDFLREIQSKSIKKRQEIDV